MGADQKKPLGNLVKGERGVILSIGENGGSVSRLVEMGLIEGAEIEVMHEAPVTRDPFVVKVRGGLIALRRNEVNHILIECVDRSAQKEGECL